MPIKKDYRPGEVIIRENTLGNSAYIIEDGKVEVCKNIGKQRVVFTTLERGSIFGEMSLVDNSPRSATVTAIADTVVTVISKANFQSLLKQNKALESVFGVLAERLRQTDQQVNPLKLTNFYYSLCNLIYHLTRSRGQRVDGMLSIDLESLIEESSMILAIDQELATKVVNRMVFTQLVKIEKDFTGGVEFKHLVIEDPAKFRDWVDFLKANSVPGEEDDQAENLDQVDGACGMLKILWDNTPEFEPQQGRTSVGYDSFMQSVVGQLNIQLGEADKLLKPYLDDGLFKLTMDEQQNIRKLDCTNTDTLAAEINKLENLRSYVKMTELLKTMASN